MYAKNERYIFNIVNIKILRSFIFSLPLIFIQCDDESKVDVSKVLVDIKVIQFDKVFYSGTLKKLKKEYPVFFTSHVSDSIWLTKQKDSIELDLLNKSNEVFGDFSSQTVSIKRLFQYIKYYFPKFISPEVYTYISKIDYKYPILLTDSLLFIAKDMYLGDKAQKYYSHFPNYLTMQMDKKYLLTDIAENIINKIVPLPKETPKMLDLMVYHGKILYLLDLFLPNIDAEYKFKCNSKKMRWAIDNEKEIWTYFIQKKILYTSSRKNKKRFIDEAPFSKFYLEIDNNSPGKIGRYLGWKIIKSYMHEYPNVNLQEMILNTNSQEIFMKSKYKPQR